MIRTIIIDDENRARKVIASILKLRCPNVTIVAEADSVVTGLEAIEVHHPDLVLLDIKMQDGSGFDLLEKIESVDFKVVFITAYEEYAIKAFKFSALDYLLKPVNSDELSEVIDRIEETIVDDNLKIRLDAFMENVDNISKEVKRIVLRTAESIHVVNVQDIVSCESDRNYTRFQFVDGRKLLVAKALNHFDELLQDYHFLRVHRSHLINTQHMLRYDRTDGGTVVMKDNTSVPVANRKREFLFQLLDNL